ncbi:MAG: ATP-dependent Clp protease proteolytic subunit [bacterium]
MRKKFGNADSLRVCVCSPGGDLGVASAFIDLWGPLRETGKLQTVGFGDLYSCAPMLIAAGSPGSRMCYKNTTIGLHEPYIDDAEVITAESTRAFQSMADKFYVLLADLTGRRVSFWRRRLVGGHMHYLSPKEAVRLGLVDLVL